MGGASNAAMATFRPFGASQAPISNLQRRVEIQRQALAQAEADLREAQGVEPDDEDEASRSPYVSEQARAILRADERRRRGLGPEQTNEAEVPVRATPEAIIAAMKKAQGRK